MKKLYIICICAVIILIGIISVCILVSNKDDNCLAYQLYGVLCKNPTKENTKKFLQCGNMEVNKVLNKLSFSQRKVDILANNVLYRNIELSPYKNKDAFFIIIEPTGIIIDYENINYIIFLVPNNALIKKGERFTPTL